MFNVDFASIKNRRRSALIKRKSNLLAIIPFGCVIMFLWMELKAFKGEIDRSKVRWYFIKIIFTAVIGVIVAMVLLIIINKIAKKELFWEGNIAIPTILITGYIVNAYFFISINRNWYSIFPIETTKIQKEENLANIEIKKICRRQILKKLAVEFAIAALVCVVVVLAVVLS